MASSRKTSTLHVDNQSPLGGELSDITLTELACRLAPEDYLLLGVRLGFAKARLDQFKHNNSGDIAGAMASMLIKWKSEQSGSPVTLTKWLSDALMFIGRSDLAGEPSSEEMSIGRLEESSGWYLEKKIDLPQDKIDKMNACLALSGRLAAVGYYNGGVDIIDIENQQITRVLDDITVRSLCYMSGDRLIICDTLNAVYMYSDCFTKLEINFHVRQESSEQVALYTDDNDILYVGSQSLKLIDVFDQSGGSPIKTIKTNLEPWTISVMKAGHIAITECEMGINDAVQVITQDGKEVCRIPGSDDHAPYSTCDRLGNIYVAIASKKGLVSIRKYSQAGEFLETIVNEQEMRVQERSGWFQLSCISCAELVLCDQYSMYVYRKRTTLTQLMTLLKLIE